MILNPHIHNEPHPNRLLKQLIAVSLGIHLGLFLFLPSTQIIPPPEIKSISVVLSASSKAPNQGEVRKVVQKKIATGPRDVFPKIPKPSPVAEQDFEPPLKSNWNLEEIPLKSTLVKKETKATKVVAPEPIQLKEFVAKPVKTETYKPERTRPEQSNSALIEGDAKGRELIYMPSTPPMDLSHDVTISLQFEVTAAGRVTNIFPLVKGNSELEKLAMGLLSQYRFEAAQSGGGNQKGLIHFTITRRP